MRQFHQLALMVVLFVFATGCPDEGGNGGTADASLDGGSGDATGDGSSDMSGQSTMVGAYCEHVVQCQPGTYDSVQACLDEETEGMNENIVRPEAKTAYIQCVQALDCSGTVDNCAGEAANAVTSDWTTVTEHTDCLSRQAACVDAFSDDLCFNIIIFIDSARTASAECLSEECDDIEQCLEDAWSD